MVNYFISQNPTFTVLDIGSGKICCVIAKINKQNNIEILGTGFQESKGVVAGAITDMKIFVHIFMMHYISAIWTILP